jgi:hypothetical protein
LLLAELVVCWSAITAWAGTIAAAPMVVVNNAKAITLVVIFIDVSSTILIMFIIT